MIINLLLNVVVLLLGAVFSMLPSVTTLPVILNYDIDGALVTGMGQLRTFLEAFWAIGLMFSGALIILTYFSVKMVIKLFLGSRAP